ncbi:hypothetical protein KSP35_19010 [Aquihabitans sp. G128]|uniref:hypothetical protein n=1 Tax=Aquihabitans sp. G128 TaxID=2849779 RepID=UPI001C24F3A8|nr:hypothetical protein [Aquihabitans sp. G128]QXC60395.1 hypothetical protein KSP35_19010 [Aquihabitans sp. G128]
MTFNALLTAALRFQRRHILGRTIAVAAGLVMVVAVFELQGALDRGVATAPADLGPGTSVVVRGAAAFSNFGEVQRPGIPVDAIATIAASGGVTRAEGDDHGAVGVLHEGRRAGATLGTWFEDDGLRPATLVAGDAPADLGVGVSTDLADDLGLSVGDPIELVGRARADATVTSIVQNRSSGSAVPDVYASLLTANALVGRDGVVGQVVVAGTGTEDQVASAVFVANPDFETLTKAKFDAERTDAEHDRAVGTRKLLTLFAGIAVAVTGLIVVSGTAAAVVRRTGELATLRTAGATPDRSGPSCSPKRPPSASSAG